MGPIVCFSFPADGHVNPTLPVIRELVRRGQQVVYYGTEVFEQAIRETGAQFWRYSARLSMPERGPGPFAHVSTTLETLLAFSLAVLDDHLAEVQQLRPAIVVFDSFAPWGRMVAQVLRVPTIASVPSILINGEIAACYGRGAPLEDPRLTAQWYAAFRERCHARLRGYGLPDPPSPPQLLQTYGDGNLVYTSRLFQPLAEAFEEEVSFRRPVFRIPPADSAVSI